MEDNHQVFINLKLTFTNDEKMRNERRKEKMFFVLSVHIVPQLDILSKNSIFMGSDEFEF